MNKKIKAATFTLYYIVFALLSGNLYSSSATEHTMINSELKEKILHSPFKTNIQTNIGKKFVAYLYAEDEQSELREDYSRKT